MNTLCQAVDDYLELRRGLGFKLINYGAYLREFASFLEQKKTASSLFCVGNFHAVCPARNLGAFALDNQSEGRAQGCRTQNTVTPQREAKPAQE